MENILAAFKSLVLDTEKKAEEERKAKAERAKKERDFIYSFNGFQGIIFGEDMGQYFLKIMVQRSEGSDEDIFIVKLGVSQHNEEKIKYVRAYCSSPRYCPGDVLAFGYRAEFKDMEILGNCSVFHNIRIINRKNIIGNYNELGNRRGAVTGKRVVQRDSSPVRS